MQMAVESKRSGEPQQGEDVDGRGLLWAGVASSRIRDALKISARQLGMILPILKGVIFLVGFLSTVVSEATIRSVSPDRPVVDVFWGASLGSISAGRSWRPRLLCLAPKLQNAWETIPTWTVDGQEAWIVGQTLGKDRFWHASCDIPCRVPKRQGPERKAQGSKHSEGEYHELGTLQA